MMPMILDMMMVTAMRKTKIGQTGTWMGFVTDIKKEKETENRGHQTTIIIMTNGIIFGMEYTRRTLGMMEIRI